MATAKKRGNSYKITVSGGYDTHGKQVRFYHTWTPEAGMTKRQIEKELERQKVLFEEECSGGNVAKGNIKFEDFAVQWFEEYAQQRLKIRTIDRYKQHSVRVYKALGHMRMDKITTRTIQRFIGDLSKDGMNQRTGKKLSPKTIKCYISFVSSIFDYATKQGVVKENPCKNATLPSRQRTEKECWTLDEAQQFLEFLEGEPLAQKVLFHLAIYGGFRRGELFGLEWQDIDFDTGILSVRRISSYTPARGIFTDTPKTNGSCRSLKLPESVLQLLIQYKAAQAEEQLRVGEMWEGTGRLFAKWNGAPKPPGNAQKWLDSICKRSGLRRMNIHSLRHLNASLLITSGADAKTVSAALGHTQVSTTLNIYTHTFAAAQARATDAVADMLTLKRVAR